MGRHLPLFQSLPRFALVFITGISLMLNLAHAGRYGEHKRIGDEAFKRALQALHADGDSAVIHMLLSKLAKRDSTTYVFHKLRGQEKDSIEITYGDLNALSGDHAESPLELLEELCEPYSRLRQIAVLQHKYMDMYYFDAPDAEVVGRDFSYALMALEDKSHFYDYNKDFVEHVGAFDMDLLKRIAGLHDTYEFSKALYSVNAINKYLTLHSFSILTTDTAASAFVKGDTLMCASLLRLAVYINAYADHFIEDAFCAGHRVVHRSFVGGFTSNKYLHDYFGKRGLRAVNLRGDKPWSSYGDAGMDKKDWIAERALVRKNAPNLEIAIQCDSVSISEIFTSFKEYKKRREDSTYKKLGGSIIDSIGSRTKDDETKFVFFVERYKALHYIPIPFGRNKNSLESARNVALERSRAHNQPDLSGASDLRKQELVTDEVWGMVERYDTSLTAPLEFARQVKAHKGIGVSFLYERHGERWKDFLRKRFSWGYEFTLKDVYDNFKYDNETLKSLRKTVVWADLSFSNTFVKHDATYGVNFAFGLHTTLDLSVLQDYYIEIGVVNEIGWHTLNHQTVFLWEPSFEVGFNTHGWLDPQGLLAVKLRATLLRSYEWYNPGNESHNWGLMLVYDITGIFALLEGVIE